MSTLRNILLGAAMAAGVVGAIGVTTPSRAATTFDVRFVGLPIFETQEEAAGYLAALPDGFPNRLNLRVGYFSVGPFGAGWYIYY